MSIPLLKKSLDLANSDFGYSAVKGSSGSSSEKQKVHKPRINHRTIPKDIRGIGDVKKSNINKLKQVRKKLNKSQEKIILTLNKLEILKRPCIDKELANIILERNNKPTIEEYIPVEDNQQGTVFTEEDFEKFEEYLRNEG